MRNSLYQIITIIFLWVNNSPKVLLNSDHNKNKDKNKED